MAHKLNDKILRKAKKTPSGETSNEVAKKDESGKRKWEGNRNSNHNQHKRHNNSSFKQGNQRQTCPRCSKPHTWYCTVVCSNCNKQGHISSDCKSSVSNTAAKEPTKGNDKVAAPKVCYGCGKPGHFIDSCPDKKKNGGNVRGRAFNINVRDAEEDPELVTGTFSVNNLLVHVLFDSGADLCFVSSKLSPRIITPLSTLDRKYIVEVASGSFDIIIGMDWLSKNRAEIVCYDKAIRIPQVDGESLIIYGDKKCKQLNLISCLKVQKYLRKGCHAILAHVSKPDPKERQLSDVAIVRDFPKVFPEDLPGLPPYQAVEFQIDLAPGAAPVALAPYRLAPSELQELASQLQELLEKGFIRPSSSPWGAPEVQFLGHIVSRQGIQVDPAKIEAIE
ncbi:uncharacterized protein [Rutidosis leptorrhynchoides]|uniref:uncharacterized protein n=1 Tax=Rutidosis leptorrhynchoides TaxID=125765 RepID=UPI003A994374